MRAGEQPGSNGAAVGEGMQEDFLGGVQVAEDSERRLEVGEALAGSLEQEGRGGGEDEEDAS